MDSVIDLWLTANLQAHAFVDPEYWQGNREKMRTLLPQARVAVHEQGGTVLGFAGLNGEFLEGLFVSESVRSLAVGKCLLDFCQNKEPALRLNVYKKNTRAIRFYEREGFRIQSEGLDEATGEKVFTMGWQREPERQVRQLREYRSSDCAPMAKLFCHTVHSVNAGDYTGKQRDARTTGRVDLPAWDWSFREHQTMVAVENGEIVGFGNMDQTGYLDRLYVHKDHQRKGIATAICDALEGAAKGKPFTTHASITAKPFFLHRGDREIREQPVLRQGIPLVNDGMEKPADSGMGSRE